MARKELIRKVVVLGDDISLRSDILRGGGPSDAMQLEIELDIQDFWELEETVKKYRYAKKSDLATSLYWKKIITIIRQSIVNEKDRVLFIKKFRPTPKKKLSE